MRDDGGVRGRKEREREEKRGKERKREEKRGEERRGEEREVGMGIV